MSSVTAYHIVIVVLEKAHPLSACFTNCRVVDEPRAGEESMGMMVWMMTTLTLRMVHAKRRPSLKERPLVVLLFRPRDMLRCPGS